MKSVHKHMRQATSYMLQQLIPIIELFAASTPRTAQFRQITVLIDIIWQHRVGVQLNQFVDTFVLQIHIVVMADILDHIVLINALQHTVGVIEYLLGLIIAKPIQVILPLPIGVTNNGNAAHATQHIDIELPSDLCKENIEIIGNFFVMRKRMFSEFVKGVFGLIDIAFHVGQCIEKHVALNEITNIQSRQDIHQHLLHRAGNAIHIVFSDQFLIVFIQLKWSHLGQFEHFIKAFLLRFFGRSRH
mmetsp:Transcript_39956/g.63955  ORF Transcript_39956/g.63955 Transcript_39956/m.63955 type:complete len:245 (-) Transcript_39956:520-1254(-)